MSYSGSSLAEAKQLYDLLQKSVELTKQVEIQAARTSPKLREVVSLAYGLLGIFKQMGLPPDVDKAVSMVMRLISTINMLRASLLALEAASGPIGWGLALVGLIGTGLATWQSIDMEARRARGEW